MTSTITIPSTPLLKTVDVLEVAAPADRPSAQPPFVKAKFQGLVLICGKCEKRSSGPRKLTSKEARKTIKSALGAQKTRLRIVQSSCLGLCPKKAIAIAAAAMDTPALLAAVHDEAEVRIVAARLAGQPVEG